MKKVILGAAVALAFGSSTVAHSAATIQFDRAGGSGADNVAVDAFDWTPGNTLVTGIYSNAPNPDGSVTSEVFAQGRLGTFVQPGGGSVTPLGTSEFTFQISFFETASGIGSPAATFAPAAGPSTFMIFYDAIADSDPITGLGFGNGTSILTGTMVNLFGNFSDFTIANNSAPVLLDQLNADNQNGTLSHLGAGSTTIEIDVTSFDPTFFLSNISNLMIDLQDTSFNALPFTGNDPSDQIFGQTPFYSLNGAGARENGFPSNANGCQDEFGNNGIRCDLHLASDGRTSFNPTAVPEPGSLLLLGAALGSLGLSRRRKTARNAK